MLEFVVHSPSDEIVPLIRQALETANLRVEQSFDLRSALAWMPDCARPHLGVALCDCQYSVLLVYGRSKPPVTLIMRGRDRRCWITLANHFDGRRIPALAKTIIRVLAVAHLIVANETDAIDVPATVL